MTWKDVVAADVIKTFQNTDEMGVTVTYTVTATAAASSIVVFLEDLAGVEFIREVSTDFNEDRQAFWISAADIASPVKGDTITYDSKIYKLDTSSEVDEEGQTWECIYKPIVKRHGQI
jgi:hypothetical protein